MSRSEVSLTLAASLTTVGLAGPPLETDDPDMPGPNQWEINLSSPFATRNDTWLFQPLLDLNYGVGERVQLKLKPRLVVVDEPGCSVEAGAGNIQLGVKWRFLDQDRHITLLASAGRTLAESRGEGAAVFFYLGLQFTF